MSAQTQVGGVSSKPLKIEKSREEVAAEREAKKAAKLAAKNKLKIVTKPENTTNVETDSKTVGTNVCDNTSKVDSSLKNITESKVTSTKVKTIRSKPNQTPEKNKPKLSSSALPLKGLGESGTDGKKRVETKSTLGDVKDDKSLLKGGIEISPAAKPGAREVHEEPSQSDKSKAELRAERRAKQDAQRAAKVQQQGHAATGFCSSDKPTKVVLVQEVSKIVAKTSVGSIKEAMRPKVSQHRVKLFNHLYNENEAPITENIMLTFPDLHPAIVRLGVQYRHRIVLGSNARCVALLNAMKQVVEDYKTPPRKEFSRGLEASLQPCTDFLQRCRPLSVSMTNALRHFKWQLTQLPNNVSDVEAKKKLQESIDTYVREQIEVADEAICITVRGKISSGDVILTYGCSSLLQRILIEAHRSGTNFRVVVVDGRPWREGREMLRRLVENGLQCSYVLISSASFIMREVTKVFLGAHALLANGYVMSRAGSSQVALLAHSYNVPVLVCCETHKFCERVLTDSFVYNEIGDPDDLVKMDSCTKEWPLLKWRSIASLTPLNLTYDVTPPDLVSAVVTELAILPCTSVPVILRIKPTEIGC